MQIPKYPALNPETNLDSSSTKIYEPSIYLCQNSDKKTKEYRY